MFTGLIEALGIVAAVEPIGGGYRLSVETELAEQLLDGDSLAVNGVCLTVVARRRGRVAFDVGPETASVTALGALGAGAPVNLERAMRADTPIGGHFVQGHVDATGTLVSVRPHAEFTWMTFAFPRSAAAYLIPKGAIAVDGISLTIAGLEADRFDVQVIPFTWAHTNLPVLTTGDRVNLEYDMLGKYAVRAAALAAQGEPIPSLP
jgi:riboflavin synthase alpha subunit